MIIKHLGWVGALGLFAIACGGSAASSDGNATPGDEDDITKSSVCAPATTLTCLPGYEITEDGCASSRVAGAAPYGRCVGIDAAAITGTWSDLQDANDADILYYGFTFNSDGTFTAQGGCRPPGSVGAAACFAITSASGKWGIVKSGPQLGDPAGASEIQLIDSFKQKTNYFYSLDKGKLSLSTVFDGKASVFTKAAAK